MLLRMTLLESIGFMRGIEVDIERKGRITSDYIDVVVTLCDEVIPRTRCEALAKGNDYEGW